ncbi:hypothetical protein C8Q76DRAFT_802414 [Earliella scabrosa]|nr:hypothetical protein C8Q76DRAFT_802414 [Earliella scabrosa]
MGSDSSSLAQDTVTNDAGPKGIVTNVDLSEELVDIASAMLERYDIENDIAAQIRTEYDKPTSQLIYFYIEFLAILIWKS